jgi:hydroxyacylglutathione hydrolase
MIQIQSFVFNPFQENTFVLYDETKECVIIDAGCFAPEEQDELSSFIDAQQLKVTALLNTHSHVDHVLGNFFVKEKYKTKLLIPTLDKPTLLSIKAYAPSYGFHQYQEAEPDGYLEENDTVKFGHQSLRVLFVPGHAPGHVAFYHEKNKILIGGDVLFYNSIGRTDLPGGNFDTLIESIHQKLFKLPDDAKVYPGHGPETTIGFEKRTNPFCALTNVSQ